MAQSRSAISGLFGSHEVLANLPATWKKPHRLFVPSTADLFRQDVPLGFIRRVFDTIRRFPKRQFQVLTKPAERLVEFHTALEREHLGGGRCGERGCGL